MTHAAALALTVVFIVAGCGFDSGGKQVNEDASVAKDTATLKDLAPLLDLAGRDLYVDPDANKPPHDCVNLECRQTTCTRGNCQAPACSGAQITSVSGTVFDPAGRVPLYNVVVYVPNSALDDIATGPSCDRCESPVSGSPIASALTDHEGKFKLEDVPVGSDVPIVFQVGKWRRQITLSSVTACTDTALDAADTRLPRDSSEGHLPKIALTTGGADALECLLRKIGISDSEFTNPTGTGRVNLFTGYHGTDKYTSSMNNGGAFPAATTGLWNDVDKLMGYDLVVLSCEGNQDAGNKSAAALQAMKSYADAGGRVFASHWHNYWFRKGPAPWPTVGTFRTNLADLSDQTHSYTGVIDTGFPKGQALADWLAFVEPGSTHGELEIFAAQHSVTDVSSTLAQRWIYSNVPEPDSIQYFSANTPMEAADDAKCGRTVFSDIHVSSGDTSTSNTEFPDGCVSGSDLSAQEKVLEFLLFDLSSCVRRDDEIPQPPPIP